MVRRVLQSLLIVGLLTIHATTQIRAAEKPSDEFVQQIIKLLSDKDREFRAAGLEQVRKSAKGEAETLLFAAQLAKLDAGGQVALLSALADRGDVAARPIVLKLTSSSQDENVRAAAIAALGKLGSAAEIPLLVNALSARSDLEKAAARKSLVQLSGDAVSKTLAADWKLAPASVKAPLIEILATRRAIAAIPMFITATLDDDSAVRGAAMNALGQVGRPEQLSLLLPGVFKASAGAERDNAEKNVALICGRINGEEARATALIDAINTVPAKDRDQLLSLIGRVGGKKLTNFVRDVATGKDAARRRLGIDALSKWPDASVADVLMEITTNATDPAERKQAFQGFVKIGATRDNRNNQQRLDRMQQAMKLAKTPDEKSLVINRTRSAYDVNAVRFVLPYVDQPQFAQIACETIVEIAHHREVRDPNKAEFDMVLNKVIQTSKDPIVVERAQRYKRGETWDRNQKK